MRGGHCVESNGRLLCVIQVLLITEVHNITCVPVIFFEVQEKSYIGRVKIITGPQVFSLM